MRRVPKPRRHWLIIGVLLLGLMSLADQVEASDGLRGDKCVVAEDEYIVEDFYFFCRILEVRGTIDGDLLGVASEVTIERTAVITGDIWAAGGRITIAGTVGDDVHFAGVSLSVSDKAHFTHDRIDVLSLALNTEITRGAVLPGDLLVYGYQAKVDGQVGGDIDFGGEALIIRGLVRGRVDASVGDSRRSTDVPGLPIYDVSFSNPGLRIEEGAVIGGDLVYDSPSRARIPAGVVQGRTVYKQALAQPDITQVKQAGVASRIMRSYVKESVRDMVTLLLIGVFALIVSPNAVRIPALHVRRRTIPTVGWGLIAFMLSFPLAIILIVISLVVILILVVIKLSELTLITAAGLLVINLALIGGFWFLLLFMGRVVVSFAIGQLIYRYVLRVPGPGTLRRWVSTLVLGAAVYVLLVNMPVPALGLTLELVTALAGIGAVVLYARDLANVSNLAMVRRLPLPHLPVVLSRGVPPLAEDAEKPVGMDNLPEGFTGFDEDW